MRRTNCLTLILALGPGLAFTGAQIHLLASPTPTLVVATINHDSTYF